MSSKKKRKELDIPETEDKLPLMERPRVKMLYTFAVITFFSVGIILLILSYSVWDDPYSMFVALGILGLGIILLTMRSSQRHSKPQKEEEKDEDTLQMRFRR